MSAVRDLVAALVAAGHDPVDAAAMVARAAMEMSSPQKSSAALRQQRYRDRNKPSQIVTPLHDDDSSRNVTNHNESVTRDARHIKDSKSDSKKDSRQPASRGSRISPDWVPSAEDRAFAKQEGFSDAEIDREAGKFRDYWLSKSGRDAAKVTWSGTWRVWIRNNVDRMGRKPAVLSSAEKLSVDEALKHYVKTGLWSRWSPCAEPGQVGCTIPPEMFEKYGLLPDGRKAA